MLPMTNFTHDCFHKDQPNDFSNMPELHASNNSIFFLRMFARAYEPASC